MEESNVRPADDSCRHSGITPSWFIVDQNPNEPNALKPAESAHQALSFLAALVARGVKEFVVSPGSRSTPLVLALQHFSEVRARVVLDERSAVFFALGIADRSHCPVALICTSGTAAANYYPGVIEASERGIPLLLLTADRPPELRDCGAGQTIDQIGIYGKFVRWSIDAEVPRGDDGCRELERIAEAGLSEALGQNPGPVHFNLPFREPFLPAVPNGSFEKGELNEPAGPDPEVSADWESLRNAGPGWIIVGSANPPNPKRWADGLFRLSDYLGWPILADVLNPLRQMPGAGERVVTQYEGLLSAGWLDRHSDFAPQAILQVGIQPTAKSLRQWLARFEGPRWQWSRLPGGLDPARKPFTWIGGTPEGLGDLPDVFPEEAFRGAWLEAEAKTVAVVSDWLDSMPENFEGKIHHEIAVSAPRKSQVLIANSMPVRDAERFWFANRPRGPRIFSNRGASGIEGLVSMAAGMADGGDTTFAVLGDLAFLHDVGGLKAASQIEGSLTFVVIDNGGGRIFGQLPIRSEEQVFDEFFLTPQAVDLAKVCEAHGIPVQTLSGSGGFQDLLSKPFRGVRGVIVQTDPAVDDERRSEWRKLFREIES
ncbi:2-succinyl-5-enolpyruvyl-6-hydroxy-3-cyclohexene-1-carboxylic-acid synthase [Puniceicoccus vermicola]|uniref:2-succinyl-5-enolpyruvyl-6-hydroxy-3-cyclohexene-1-carboxylate synthase n=1 Tax=Puniceicoccus vermicola TaxID=388746 RepID=A0A7X1B0N3_9BACT|nr:2-succinyl-5-enolpyruvyl-6-hydroxy-3-cyclohexene-1-carboxylic-acid synthase [Puniceicoccus vermicola]MBC2603458.1 2-succinyl-5-enolpyruvyl-6-hydroxy-3-cyclohexene-1-carboxylic-acid synthase [Puniceicoccus vermicola]